MESIAKGEVKVDVSQIIELEKANQIQNQTIGEQRKTVQILEQQLKEKEAANKKELLETTEKLVKEIRIVETTDATKRICEACGWNHSSQKTNCYNCGRNMPKIETYKYKGLDDVVDMIRKEEAKKLKVDVLKLEEQTENLTFETARLEKTVKKLEKEKEIEVTEAKSRLRERLNGIIEEKDKEIEGLHAEMLKIQEDKTDLQIEEARKQEIIDLKVYVADIEEEKNALIKLLPIWKQRQFNNRKAKEKVLRDITVREEKIESISNSYPMAERINSWGERFNTYLNNVKWIKNVRNSTRYDDIDYGYDLPY